MVRSTHQEAAPGSCGPGLTIDDTTAHLVAPASQAAELLAWFQRNGLRCRLGSEPYSRGFALIDFGDPSPAEEKRIRSAFGQWQAHQRAPR